MNELAVWTAMAHYSYDDVVGADFPCFLRVGLGNDYIDKDYMGTVVRGSIILSYGLLQQ